jgi:hypothetical protein
MAMGAGIASMLIVEWSAMGVAQVPPIVIFASIALVSALLAWRVFGSIGPLGRDRPVDRALPAGVQP